MSALVGWTLFASAVGLRFRFRHIAIVVGVRLIEFLLVHVPFASVGERLVKRYTAIFVRISSVETPFGPTRAGNIPFLPGHFAVVIEVAARKDNRDEVIVRLSPAQLSVMICIRFGKAILGGSRAAWSLFGRR